MQIGRAKFGPARIAWADAATAAIPDDDVDRLTADEPAALAESDVWARLGTQQARRHAALSGTAAHRFLVGRALLAQLIDELTDAVDLGFTTTCERCGADHGRPRLERAPVAVSISYAESMVAVAAVSLEDASAIGVDIERIPVGGAGEPLNGLANLFGAATPPDITRWTLLEAAVKADGRGIRIDLRSVDIDEPSTGRLPDSRVVRIAGRTDVIDAAVLDGPAGFVVSAAIGVSAAICSTHVTGVAGAGVSNRHEE